MPFKSFRAFVVALFLTTGFSASALADTVRIVGLGDSLMAGYRLDAGEGFPAQLEKALRDKGHDVSVADAGVSGDTTSGGRSRLDWSVPDDADLVILELGGNDALRGISPDVTRENLDFMIARLKERGIAVVLAGMLAPPNMGDDYAATFNAIYPELAKKHDVALYPFFLDGVATKPELMLGDGIHPNGAGVARMVEGFLPVIEEALGQIDSAASN